MQSKSAARAQEGDRLAVAPLAVLVVIIISWVALFCNNLPQIAALFGFDRDGHQQYIDYILTNKALPLADEGWQMYQPPLFYLLSALIIGPFGWAASTDSAVLALRAVSALTGIVHLVLIFLCLRLVFPKQPRRQMVGLLIAGFLPANLCLSITSPTKTSRLCSSRRRSISPCDCYGRKRLPAVWRLPQGPVWGWLCLPSSLPCWRFRSLC